MKPQPPGNGRVMRARMSDFRSLADVEIVAEGRSVALIGGVGSGKTHVLEALSLVSAGPALRRAELSDYRRIGGNRKGEGWAVSADVISDGVPVRVGTGSAKDKLGRERRIVRIDGANAPASALQKHLRALSLTPEMDHLFAAGRAPRLAFLDRLIAGLEPEHAVRMSRYERARSDRQRVLAERPGEAAWLAALEERMACEGIAMADARRRIIKGLKPHMAQDGAPVPSIAVRGFAEDRLETSPAVHVETALAEALAAGRALDAAAGRALTGPHRTVFSVSGANGVPIEAGSTGEQKSVLITLMAGAARLFLANWGAPPVLFLDGVAAYLDGSARDRLFTALQSIGAQIWATAHEKEALAGLMREALILHAHNGKISLHTT